MAENLVEIFQKLGVADPEEWAASQAEEGIDQVARATILRALVDLIGEAPERWKDLEHSLEERVRAAVSSVNSAGVDDEDLSVALKAFSFSLIFNILTLTDGSSVPKTNPAEVDFDIRRLDPETGECFGGPLMLHESLREVGSAILGNEIVEY